MYISFYQSYQITFFSYFCDTAHTLSLTHTHTHTLTPLLTTHSSLTHSLTHTFTHSHMANIAVKFTPPSACRVQLSFFERLYEHKLDERGLDDSSEAVRAFLGASEGVTQWLLRADSLTPSSTHSPTPESWSCSGVLKNVNTTNVSSDVDTLHETHCSSATWPLTHSPTTLLLHYSTTPPLSTTTGR